MKGALSHSRPPSYLSCASLARELDMSETTVRDMVDKGLLPRPIRLGGSVRWNWGDVQMMLAGIARSSAERDPYMVGAKHATSTSKG